MIEFILSIIALLASLIINPTVPGGENETWKGAAAWRPAADHILEYSAQSTQITSLCRDQADAFLTFPLLIQGVHQVTLDGKLIAQSGDPSFKQGSDAYSTLSIPCSTIGEGHTLEWKAFSSTHSMARIKKFPEIKRSNSLHRLFNRTFIIIGAGAMPMVGFLSFALFFGKTYLKRIVLLLCGTLFLGVYLLLLVPDAFAVQLSSFSQFRMSDSCLWMGSICIFQIFYAMKVIPRSLCTLHNWLAILAIFVIAMGRNLDDSQVGSSLGILANIMGLSYMLGNSISRLKAKTLETHQTLQVFAVLTFVFSGTNDILLACFTVSNVSLFSIGCFSSVAMLALAINEMIRKTYKERDFLRKNLQQQVEEKTLDLRVALENLKKSQADQIQSSKLASIGTLSAGIAHEINNSLNYVNSSVDSLTKILQKDTFAEIERKKAVKLLGFMNQGLAFTFAIIKNLKQHASANDHQIEDIDLKELVDGVLILLRSKIGGEVEIKVNIPIHQRVKGFRIGLSEVLLNLIGNAVDAMAGAETTNRQIAIQAFDDAEATIVSVRDNGPGIPQSIRSQVFDPFFTTKPLGQGTGLGLHIVLKEMSRVGGTVHIQDPPDCGTDFQLRFPKTIKMVANA